MQPILGTDKRNPIFSVYRPAGAAAGELQVYYGAELLEVVPDDSQHPAFRLLLGRLYNAGLKAVTLQRSFGVDRKSLQRWGRALCSNDPQHLARALAGRRGPRKFTPEIRAFVTLRFAQLYREQRTGYCKRLRAEIAAVFGVHLSGECLRIPLRALKAQLRNEVGAAAAGLLPENRATTCAEVTAAAPATPGGAVPATARRNQSPVFAPDPRFCRHLGVLLFSPVLLRLEAVASAGWLLKQWLATLLLGAANIEQTKLLDFEDLASLLGRTLRNLFSQRLQLSALAASATVSVVLRCNAALVGAPQCRDFYFDPHTKHYTGQQPILKGWCARIRWADKVLHSDFVHTATGEPVYLECADNYLDLRERLARLRPRLRAQLALPAHRLGRAQCLSLSDGDQRIGAARLEGAGAGFGDLARRGSVSGLSRAGTRALCGQPAGTRPQPAASRDGPAGRPCAGSAGRLADAPVCARRQHWAGAGGNLNHARPRRNPQHWCHVNATERALPPRSPACELSPCLHSGPPRLCPHTANSSPAGEPSSSPRC